MSLKIQLKNLIKQYNLAPNKLLGQNFLVDENVLEKIMAAGELKKTDNVLEIGPGLGFLTRALTERAGFVLAVEKDKNFVEILKEEFKNEKNIKIVQEDILKVDFLSFFRHSERSEESHGSVATRSINSKDSSPAAQNDDYLNYKVVANIPYYLTSRLIKNLLETKNRPQKIVLMIQKEVAQRICASPPEMSLLALSVQFYAKPKIKSFVSKNSFWPAPKIDSAILEITPFKENNEIPPEKFFKLIHAAFSAPRKQLFNNLKNKLEMPAEEILEALKNSQIEQNRRAESLSMEDWFKIIKNLSKL